MTTVLISRHILFRIVLWSYSVPESSVQYEVARLPEDHTCRCYSVARCGRITMAQEEVVDHDKGKHPARR